MSQLAVVLNVTFGLFWLALTLELLRRPPDLPPGASRWVRRATWGVLAVLALGVGAWGVPLSTITSTDQPPDAAAGNPTDGVSWFLRTPFALVERDVVLDGEGRTLRDERRETRQIPPTLLGFLLIGLWIRWRSGRPDGLRRGSAAAALLACIGMGACPSSGDGGAREAGASLADVPRPDRAVLDVAWDTLVRVHAGADDTLLFSAGTAAADEHGFAILDHYGSRVARFAWDGALRSYVGRRGSGPGELRGPRHVDLDGHGTLWVLDVDNARISGFDGAGQLLEELSLAGLPLSPSRFAVSHEGTFFRFMLNADELVPYEMDRVGAVTAGRPIDLEAGTRASGLALQGVVSRTDTSDGWVYALGAGDGILPMRSTAWDGRRLRYPEAVSFPVQQRVAGRSGGVSTVTTRLSAPVFSALSVDAWEGTLYVVFMGSMADAGRLLERWDLETGRYLDTVLLPKAGHVAVWEDRIVISATHPEPEVLVLRAPWDEPRE